MLLLLGCAALLPSYSQKTPESMLILNAQVADGTGGPESLTSEAVRISHAGVEWANLVLAGKPGAADLAHKALTEVAL